MPVFRPVLLALLLLATLTIRPLAAQPLPGRADWSESYSLAQEEALLTRRPILLTFYTGWCSWCQKLDAITFRDPTFVEMSGHFVPVRVNGDDERGLRGLFRVTGYPTTILLSRTGKELGRINGFKGPDPFVRALQVGLDRSEPLAEVTQNAQEHPEDPRMQYALGDVLLARGEFDGARGAFRRVLELEQEPANDLTDDAHLDMALTYLFNYDLSSSLPLLKAYLDGYPESERRDQGLFFYGLALAQSGQIEEGIQHMEEAMAMTTLEYIKVESKRLMDLIQKSGKQGEE